MAYIKNKISHSSGIALGGIGTGTVELLPDGEFHAWQIANPTRWSAVNGTDDGEGSTGCLSFYIRAELPDGSVQFRKLGQRIDSDDFPYTMSPWNRPMETVLFNGQFPCADLTYQDKSFPLLVSMKATAPFVPHKEKTSAVPGFSLDFHVENPCQMPIKVSLLGVLRPEFMAEKSTVNQLWQEKNTTAVFLESEVKSKAANCGNATFSLTTEGERSYITGDFNRFAQQYCAWTKDLGVTYESLLIEYRENGTLPCSRNGKRPPQIPDNLEVLSREELCSLLGEVNQCLSNALYLQRIRHTKPSYPSSKEELLAYLGWLRRHESEKKKPFGACALSAEALLSSGASLDARFVLTWYFPNHYKITTEKDESGNFTFKTDFSRRFGHYYENLFADSREVNRTLLDNYEKIFTPAQRFAKLLYAQGIPSYWSDAWSGQLSTIVKDSWWLKNDSFGLWEGLGSCGFHTTDITYHASFGLTVLFPELQKRQMRMGAKFQRKDGRVHHFFTPDLEHVDNGFDRVDMNPQFVLMVCRDYLFTGDKAYVEDLWKNILAAMDATQSLDSDEDGLPDTDTMRNTYDAWNFAGASSYISLLWLASLRAAVCLANVMGDTDRAEAWEKLREKGLQSLEKKLWNGKYYNLWTDGEQSDGCLMTDQLDGEWFLRAAGLEPNLSDKRVKKVLTYLFRHNFSKEGGLINATCPDAAPTNIYTYKNCQAESVWTGIGYAVSALCLRVGASSLAEKEVKAIHNAQMSLGQLWNHWECGYRYTRPLSSWTTLLSLSGQRMNAAEKTLYLSPCKADLTVPVITSEGCALAKFCNGECRLTVTEGSFDGWRISLPAGMKLLIE